MARILLIMPHLPQRMGTPYLGQQYIASSLLRAGHEVRVIDAAAVRWKGTDADIVAAAEAWAPDMIGMTLFTYNALRGYLLAKALKHCTRLLVAGGPHVTVDPAESLANGFDVAISGEGELAILSITEHLDHGTPIPPLPGIHTPLAQSASRASIVDLDALALPLHSYSCYDPNDYSEHGLLIPGGMMTSRGCPARCTFCANYVTGRAYRWRSAQNVIDEMLHLQSAHGIQHFPFWDDAFTARRRRLNEICDAILNEPSLRDITWTCITPGNMVKPRDLDRMRKAGCTAINFGIESGDYNILKIIQKGQRPEQVRAAVAAAKSSGMITIVNFMFGFPQEDLQALQNTRDFMEDLSEDASYFNNRGVLVPFPGTEIYDRWHSTYEFTGWWLDPKMIIDEVNPHVLNPQAMQTYLEEDPTLDLDFFHYSDDVHDKIAECVRFKAQHNASTLEKIRRKYSSSSTPHKVISKAPQTSPNKSAASHLADTDEPHSILTLLQKTAASVG